MSEAKLHGNSCFRLLLDESIGVVVATAKLELPIIDLDWSIGQVFVQSILRNNLSMSRHLPDVKATSLSRLLFLGRWHFTHFSRVIQHHGLGFFEVRVRHHWGWKIGSIRIRAASLALWSLFATTVGGKTLTGGAVGKIVLNMCVQKERGKQEIEEANEHANDPRRVVYGWLVANLHQARVIAQISLARTKAIWSDIHQRENIQRAVNHNFHPDSENEQHERIVVLNSNTVINPRTVVIESFNALVADWAVARSSSLYDFALGAQVGWVDVSQELEERCSLLRQYSSGILARSIEEGQEYNHSGNSTSE